MKIEILIGSKSWSDAKRKATYGRNDWVLWIGKDGGKRAARMTAETIKRAMLATGTQKYIYVQHAGDKHTTILSWRLAALYWKNAKYRESRAV